MSPWLPWKTRPTWSVFCFLAAAFVVTACAKKPVELPDETPTGPPPICAVESPELCLQDGVALYHGLERERDRDAAREKFELACAGGDTRGCTYLGMMLKDSGETADVLRGIGLLDEACESGEGMACAQLGSHLFGRAWMNSEQSGQPTTDAFIAAIQRLRKACEGSETEDDRTFWGFSARGYACANLAAAFEHGHGVNQDVSLALDLNRQACELGYQGGCAQVGYFTFKGMGTEADPATAAAIYEQACQKNDHMACTNLSYMLVKGEHVPADPDRAKQLLEQPCNRKYPGSCELLKEIETLDE